MATSKTLIKFGDYHLRRDCVVRVIDRLGINIILNTLDGRNVGFVVRNDDRIIDVVKKIGSRIRFEDNEYRLSFNGTILEDDKIIGYYNIGKGSIIDVVARPKVRRLIFAKTMDGKSVAFEVTMTDRIIDIKKKIQEKLGMSPDEQRLVYQGGTLDDNDKTTDYYNIVDRSIIDVVARPRGGMQKNTKTMDDINMIELNTKKLEISTGGLLEKKYDNYEKKIFIKYIHSGSGENKNYRIIVCDNDTIKNVKDKINERNGWNDYEYRLFCRGDILDDCCRFGDYDIEEGETLWLIKTVSGGGYSIEIKIGGDGDIIIYRLIYNESILDMKKWIQEQTGVSVEEQQLMYDGGILDDGQSIMKIHNLTMIKAVTLVDRGRSMFVRMKQKNLIILNVKLMNKILDIKRMIQEKTGLSTDEQILKLSGNILIDDKKVYEYKIVTNSNIDVCEILTIILLSENMETIPVEIMSDDRIIDVKKQIELKTGLPCKDQILQFKDQSLNDDDFLYGYNIGSMSDILMTELPGLEIRGICVVISNGHCPQDTDYRAGTNLDVENIKNTFQPLGYEIEVHRDVHSSSMNTIIEDTKKSIEESHINMIVFVLSHGDINGVVMQDGVIFPFRNIYTPFSNERFPKFSGKSKLFFFSCCLGTNVNKAVRGASNNTIQYDVTPCTNDLVPAMADFFLGYATCESFVAGRDTNIGTLYVDCLCKVVRDHSLWSVADIHQEVQSVLSMHPINGHFQMPQYNSRLRNHAYFYEDN